MCRNWIHTFFWGNQSAEKSLPLFFQMSEASTFHFLYSHDSRCCTLFWFCRDCVVANLSAGKFYEFPLSPGLGSNFASGLCLLCPPSPHLCAANRALCRHEGNLILICNSPAHMRMIRTKRVAPTNNDDDNSEHHRGRAVNDHFDDAYNIHNKEEGRVHMEMFWMLRCRFALQWQEKYAEFWVAASSFTSSTGILLFQILQNHFAAHLTLLFWRQMKIGW